LIYKVFIKALAALDALLKQTIPNDSPQKSPRQNGRFTETTRLDLQ